MNADPTRIVMTETRCRNCGIPIVQVYHRDFAMMCPRAGSPRKPRDTL